MHNNHVVRLIQAAQKASQSFSTYSVDKIAPVLHALSEAGIEKAPFYNAWSAKETGYGNPEDNIKKCLHCMTDIMERYEVADFVEPSIDVSKKIISFPKPAGIIVALIPSTNPIMTIYYKTMMAMMTRNVLIFSPHPKCRESSLDAVDFMADVAEKAGAPKGTIQPMRETGIDALNALMESPEINLILATGGPGRVKAAYSSGNPAFGMGAGNPPCFVHHSADIESAARHVVDGNSFDHGLPCVAESVIIAEESIDQPLKLAISKAGGYFVGAKEDEQKLRAYLFPEGKLNPEAIGKSAQWIADQTGITTPADIKSLIINIHVIGIDEPLSQEKMFPVMGYLVVRDVAEAIDAASAMLKMAGKGHSALIHSKDHEVIRQYGAALPVCRIAVNSKGVEGSSGISTHLTSGPLIGTGFFGGSVIDENVGPQHLIQWSRLAYTRNMEFPAK